MPKKKAASTPLNVAPLVRFSLRATELRAMPNGTFQLVIELAPIRGEDKSADQGIDIAPKAEAPQASPPEGT